MTHAEPNHPGYAAYQDWLAMMRRKDSAFTWLAFRWGWCHGENRGRQEELETAKRAMGVNSTTNGGNNDD